MNSTVAPVYVAIEGVIGVGKTTLARYLQQDLGATLSIEEFEDNPFLPKFYQDRARYAFQTQVFFLLSRYDQQQRIHHLPRPVVSDYIFEKDQLFARQNLVDEELRTYERVFAALQPNNPRPDLIVFLRANTQTLLTRIARRDRPFERNMDPGYIETLRLAYEQFFAEYDATRLLTIDTTDLDIVEDPDDRNAVLDQIRGILGEGPQQATLPGIDTTTPPIERTRPANPLALEDSSRRLADFQRFHHAFDAAKGFDTDLFLNFAMLQEEIGEMAKAMVTWAKHAQHNRLTETHHAALRDEFADVLAFLLKLANYVGIDLEAAYLEKMELNQRRQWDS
jgi:deoxyguanosine kinase